MEDQGKQLMLAAALAFGIMMVWLVVFPPEKPTEAPKEVKSAQIEKASDIIEIPKTEEKELVRGEELFFDFKFKNLDIRFSSYGASISHWKMLDARLEDRSVDPVKPDNLIRIESDKYRFLRLSFPGSTFDIPAGSEWKGEKLDGNSIRFTWESTDLRVTKLITIHPKDFVLMMEIDVEVVGATKANQLLAISLYSKEDPEIEEAGMFDRVSREWKASCYYDEELHTSSAKELLNGGLKLRAGQLNWAGFDHAYFLAAGAIVGAHNSRLECRAYPLKGIVGGMGVDFVQPSVELIPGKSGLKSTIAFFLGPKYLTHLNATNTISGVATMVEESVSFGWFGLIAKPLLLLLNFFQGLVGNWGIAILLLTITVKGLTLPFTHKSLVSMKGMSKLKPELEKIKEKYKDDKARQNTETMNLFKTHKVNPMSGCLPMILQMPIWFALYRGLTVAGELYQAPFISGWIDDLTLPDPFYIMPVLLMGMMFVQTRMTPTTGTGAQQKMIQYGMPIMFGVMSFFFPSGLTLYILTNTLFTAAHHFYMHKTDPTPAVVASNSSKVIDVEEAIVSGNDSEASPNKPVTSKPKNNKKSGKGKKNRKK